MVQCDVNTQNVKIASFYILEFTLLRRPQNSKVGPSLDLSAIRTAQDNIFPKENVSDDIMVFLHRHSPASGERSEEWLGRPDCPVCDMLNFLAIFLLVLAHFLTDIYYHNYASSVILSLHY